MVYSIIDEDWIPVKYINVDDIKYVSLRTLFKDAHLIGSISDEQVMTNLGILRLACAFFMDMEQMKERKDRQCLLKKESFDMNLFDDYVRTCTSSGNCFDLFDDAVPFLQTPNMEGEKKSVSNSSDFACSGTETIFFNGKYENSYAFTPAECARNLCQKMTTVIKDGGKGYHTFYPLKNAIFMLNKGKNLYETIILNSLSKNEWTAQGTIYYYGTEKEDGIKGPSWKQVPNKPGEKINIELSMLAMMTFMPVNIKFILNDKGLVKEIFYTGKDFKVKGTTSNENLLNQYIDPMIVSYEEERKTKDGPVTATGPLTFNEDIFVWEQMEAIEAGYIKSGKSYRYINKPAVLSAAEDPEAKDFGYEEVETWSACKDGSGKGIVFHGIFPVNRNSIEGAKEQRDEAIRFSEIISSFQNDRNLHTGLELLTGLEYEEAKKKSSWSRIADRHRKNIGRKLKQYMNAAYMNVYLPEHSMIKDVESAIEHRDDFKKEAISRMKEIANNYINGFGNSYEELSAKVVCGSAIRSYFGKLEKE